MKSIALGVLLALAAAGSAQAQTTSVYDLLGPGLPAGHFNLYPSVSYEYMYDDNILFMSTDLPGSVPVASGVNVLRARFLADLPLRDGRVRMLYAPFFRSYTNDRFVPEDQINQVLGVEGTFHQSGRVAIGFRDDYAKGTLSLQEQVVRNGVPFGLGHYEVHNPRLDFGMRVGLRQGFSILPSYSHSAFSGLVSGFGQAVDYGYTTKAIEGRYNYRLAEPATAYLYSILDRTLQTVSDAPDVTIRSNTVGLGLTRTLHALVVTQVSVGYETMQFDGGVGEDFSGPVGEANVSWEVANLNRINVVVLRRPYASIYFDSNYYLATVGQVRWIRQLWRSSYLDAAATIQQSDFVPVQGVGREERLMRAEVGLGHEFLRHLRGYAGFNVEQRESNVVQMTGGVGADPFNYQLHRFIFRIEAGWM
ncbi:MAG TPA: outer membrane beta-barrel protein [Verrucomicrobiae bacterium]|nr:outer membrane beta-barrel protein [Verrucomicrobiae bacterium]